MQNLETVPLSGGLYLVSTPIGNLRDITLRALDVLRGADIVVCEDTRVTGKLLEAYDIRRKMMPYNDHNAARQRGPILSLLTEGKAVAFTSDAGTPLVSDPGYKLVRDCLDLGLPVIPVPGANAVLPALQLSGLPSDAFVFAGFTPAKSTARKALLSDWRSVTATLIFYETGPRVVASLEDMKVVFGDRPAALVREITKKFEESRRGLLSELIVSCTENPPKGELVVLVAGDSRDQDVGADELRGQLQKALQTMSVKDAAAFVAEATGQKKRAIYDLALTLSKQGDDEEEN